MTRARASATRWRWPPESWPGRRCSIAAEFDHCQRLHAPCLRASSFADAFDHQPIGHVLADRHMRKQRIVLEHRIDVALVRRHALCRFAENFDMSGSGCSNPAISRRHVVLPEPDGPSIAKNSPSARYQATRHRRRARSRSGARRSRTNGGVMEPWSSGPTSSTAPAPADAMTLLAEDVYVVLGPLRVGNAVPSCLAFGCRRAPEPDLFEVVEAVGARSRCRSAAHFPCRPPDGRHRSEPGGDVALQLRA